jgi:hypothetical protein
MKRSVVHIVVEQEVEVESVRFAKDMAKLDCMHHILSVIHAKGTVKSMTRFLLFPAGPHVLDAKELVILVVPNWNTMGESRFLIAGAGK